MFTMAGKTILEMLSKSLDETATGKRMPSIGFEVGDNTQFDSVAHAYLFGYRHFLFAAHHAHLLAELKLAQSKNNDLFQEETFLTLKVPCPGSDKQSVEEMLTHVLSHLTLQCIDNVLIYHTQDSDQNVTQWTDRWKEIEDLVCRGLVHHAGLCLPSAHHPCLKHICSQCTTQPRLLMVDHSAEHMTCTQGGMARLGEQYSGVVGVCLHEDRLRKFHGYSSCITNFPKNICRSLMDKGIPYTVKSHDKNFISNCFQVFDFINAN